MSSTPLVFSIPPKAGNTSDARNTSHPQVIVLLPWLDAKASHLKYYTSKYASLYPSATQIVIQSDYKALIGGTAFNAERLAPAVEILTQLGVLSAAPPPILFHAMSGGGVAQLLHLAIAIRRHHLPNVPPSHQVPVAFVFDSGPSTYHGSDLRNAMTMTYPPGVQKAAVFMTAQLLWTDLCARAALGLAELPQDVVLPGVLNPTLFPWTERATPRLYVFSDTDAMSLVPGVRAHVQEARERGLNVSVEEFNGSRHVGHAFADPKRYWSAVQRVWDEAVIVKGQSKL
ncbi:unnamed protein product [Mycena citricolor]|uniref:Alpha/beta-hydrolase n=1 Tax=Mycena citricolor TaxID=2018698 RepID=A0AAD2GQF5_9AGAR|nr:unnamed protein product [Mycena citricolor]